MSDGHEFDIIERYFAGLITTTGPQVVLGPGDDCGIFQVAAGQEICISTDTLTSGVHFLPGAAPAIIAQRALVANLSDLAAMGAEPLVCTLALTLDETATADAWLAPFAEQLQCLVAQYAIPLIGGNLSRGPLSLTFTVLGTVPAGGALRRDQAQLGDDVYVTGNPGDAAAGLQRCLAGHPVDAADPLIRRYAFPTPRLATGQALRNLASSMIDISDGLLGDLDHICQRSEVGVDLLLAALPLSPDLLAATGHDQALQCALSGGDDYELCFTAAPPYRDAIDRVARDTQVNITRIGQVVAGNAVVLRDAQGRLVNQARRGYQHF